MPDFQPIDKIPTYNDSANPTGFKNRVKCLDSKGNIAASNHQGHKFELVTKKERSLSDLENFGRKLIAFIPIVCTLGLVLKNRAFLKFATTDKQKGSFATAMQKDKASYGISKTSTQTLESLLENPSWEIYSQLTEKDVFLIAVRFFKSNPSLQIDEHNASVNKLILAFEECYHEENLSSIKPIIEEALELSKQIQMSSEFEIKQANDSFTKIQALSSLKDVATHGPAKLNSLDAEILKDLKSEVINSIPDIATRRSIASKMLNNSSYHPILNEALDMHIRHVAGAWESCDNIDNKISDNFMTLLASDSELKQFVDDPSWEKYVRLNTEIKYLIAGRYYFPKEKGIFFNFTSKDSYLQRFENEFKGAHLGKSCLRAIKEALQISEVIRLLSVIKLAGPDKIAKLNDLNQEALNGIKDDFIVCCKGRMPQELVSKMLLDYVPQEFVKVGIENLIFHYKNQIDKKFFKFCNSPQSREL